MNKFSANESLGSKSPEEIEAYIADIDDEDFPVAGLTAFDVWFSKLRCIMIASGFVSITEAFDVLDREDWRDYYESEYTPQEAFEEDMTCYGD